MRIGPSFSEAKEWSLYDLNDKQVMVLDEHDIHPAKESELKLLCIVDVTKIQYAVHLFRVFSITVVQHQA